MKTPNKHMEANVFLNPNFYKSHPEIILERELAIDPTDPIKLSKLSLSIPFFYP